MFDVQFDDLSTGCSDRKGWSLPKQDCVAYITGLLLGQFIDELFNQYAGGTVSVINNKTGKTVYSRRINGGKVVAVSGAWSLDGSRFIGEVELSDGSTHEGEHAEGDYDWNGHWNP
jgi:hypothetical protein